jgi:hypothetical protein
MSIFALVILVIAIHAYAIYWRELTDSLGFAATTALLLVVFGGLVLQVVYVSNKYKKTP